MNFENLIGGGLVGAGLGWLACLLVIFFVHLPRIPLVFAIASFISYGLTGAAAGIGILVGGVGPFGVPADIYRTAFVAAQFIGTWGFVISMLLHVFWNKTAVDRYEYEDTNERVREIQTRGQSDQPQEQLDRQEGHDHRSDIDTRLAADTDLRRQERQDEKEERAEERQADREERAEERDS